MLRVYKEHPEFGEFTKFDAKTGRLIDITEDEFLGFLPDGKYPASNGQPIQVIEGNGATVFLGETPETHTRFPRRVYYQITRNCNLKCPTCFIRSERGKPCSQRSGVGHGKLHGAERTH